MSLLPSWVKLTGVQKNGKQSFLIYEQPSSNNEMEFEIISYHKGVLIICLRIKGGTENEKMYTAYYRMKKVF